MPNLSDDKSFTGPISAETLMEEYEKFDPIKSVPLPSSLPVCFEYLFDTDNFQP